MIIRAAVLIVIERGHQLLLHFVFKHSKVYKESQSPTNRPVEWMDLFCAFILVCWNIEMQPWKLRSVILINLD